MNKEKDMSKEAFNETIDNFEVFGKLTLWGRKNIKYHVKKLQEENDSLKKILDTMGLDANKILYLEKENKELKETLKGTTHCFDEEEHQRLIKENEELKKKLCKKQNVNNLFYRQDLNNPFDKLKYENTKMMDNSNFKYDDVVTDKVKNIIEENKELKKTNASLQNSLSLSRQKYNNDKARYRRKYKSERRVLTEFEKWLEEKKLQKEIPQHSNSLFVQANLNYCPCVLNQNNNTFDECLDKLQELKEGKK